MKFPKLIRFEFDDERLQKLLHMIHECFRVIDMSGGLLNLVPWIRHLAPNLCGYRPLVNAHKPLWKFIEVKLSSVNCYLIVKLS